MKRNSRQAIKDAIQGQGNRPMDAGEIRALIPLDEVTTQAIYNSLSTMKLQYKELDYDNGKYTLKALPPFQEPVEQRHSEPPVEIAQAAGSEALNMEVSISEAIAKDYPFGAVEQINQRVQMEQLEREQPDRRTKIQWSAQEQWTLARQVHELRRGGYNDLLLAVEKAQRQVLPNDRRRTITNRQMIGEWIYPMLDILKHNDTLQAAVKTLENRPPPPPPPLNYAELATNLMLGELLARGRSMLKGMLIEALTSPEVKAMLNPPPVVNVPKHNPTPTSQEREKLPRIMIYGLRKPIHRNEISRDFKNIFDIRWGDTGDPGVILKQKNASMDKVFVLTDYVPHSFTDTMKSEIVPYQMITGSITRLREVLNDYATQE